MLCPRLRTPYAVALVAAGLVYPESTVSCPTFEGQCVITGLYMEGGGTGEYLEKDVPIWGGTIVTNSITVDLVKP